VWLAQILYIPGVNGVCILSESKKVKQDSAIEANYAVYSGRKLSETDWTRYSKPVTLRDAWDTLLEEALESHDTCWRIGPVRPPDIGSRDLETTSTLSGTTIHAAYRTSRSTSSIFTDNRPTSPVLSESTYLSPSRPRSPNLGELMSQSKQSFHDPVTPTPYSSGGSTAHRTRSPSEQKSAESTSLSHGEPTSHGSSESINRPRKPSHGSVKNNNEPRGLTVCDDDGPFHAPTIPKVHNSSESTSHHAGGLSARSTRSSASDTRDTESASRTALTTGAGEVSHNQKESASHGSSEPSVRNNQSSSQNEPTVSPINNAHGTSNSNPTSERKGLFTRIRKAIIGW
jgi:hypothetical protein